MSTLLVISAIMLVVSLILSGAMAIGWASLGRPRHALSWSIAYLLYGGEVVASMAARLFVAVQSVAWALGLAFILASATLLAIGARQRAGLPSGVRSLCIAAASAYVATELLSLIPAVQPFTGVAGSLFTLGVLPVAIIAIKPRNRRADGAEWAAIGALLLFALFELLLVVTNLARCAEPANTALTALYGGIYLIGLIPVFVASGIAAVLLLAFDLAERLRSLASHDPLTGVLNRRGFHEAALRAIANGRRQRQSIAVAIADIDHFKSINDRFGHTAGDRTLHYICRRLASGLRTEDLVGRIGGEEFALLLVNSTAEQAAQAMERIRVEVAAGFSEDGAPVPVTISFGVASVHVASSNAETAMSEACDEADRALYRSKIDGRNRTTLAGVA